jgi:SAM-dependent methyltransferase
MIRSNQREEDNSLNLGCGNQPYGAVRVDRYRGAANVIADVEAPLPLRDNTFDVVYSRFLFEHLRNPSLVLKEMVRVLKPEGKVILITDNAAYPPFHLPHRWGSGFHVGGYRGMGPEDRHYGMYTREHIVNHLQQVGLEVVTVDYVYADAVGGEDGAWQKASNLLRLHRLSILKPFCMANILAIGTKPTENPVVNANHD